MAAATDPMAPNLHQGVIPYGTHPLRGLTHAGAFLQIYDNLKKHLTVGGYDLMTSVSNAILTYYMRAVEEDPKARTGFSYRRGFDDERCAEMLKKSWAFR